VCQVSVVCMHGNVKVDFNLVKSVGFALPLRGLKSEIRISKYETISKPECQMIKTFPALIQYIHDSDMFWILNFGHSYFFRISCLGLPWRNLPGALCCRCNFSGVESIELSTCKPGLGQGFRIYRKLIKQTILTLQKVTSLNDLPLMFVQAFPADPIEQVGSLAIAGLDRGSVEDGEHSVDKLYYSSYIVATK